MLLSISCKFRHFHQKNRHVITKHAFQQILCFSAFHVSFAISIKKNRHVTTKHAFQQILCFSAFHVSLTISVKKIALSQQFILAPWFIFAPRIKGKCLLLVHVTLASKHQLNWFHSDSLIELYKSKIRWFRKALVFNPFHLHDTT